jgi:O-antigen ligase
LAGTNILLGIALLCWILEGDYGKKWEFLKQNKLIWIIYSIILLLLISAFFSHSKMDGFAMSKGLANSYIFIVKHFIWLSFLLPILLTSDVDYKKLVGAFLFGVFFSEIVSYLVYFHIIDINYFKKLGLLSRAIRYHDPSPFMHHSFYSVFLAITILFILEHITKFRNIFFKIISGLFLISATINLFINGGRVGQIAFIIGIVIYVIGKFKKWKTFLITALILSGILFSAYKYSPIFHSRVNLALSDIEKAKQGRFNTSWGQRIGLDIVASHLFFNFPYFFTGLGMGDAKKEFMEFAKEHYPKIWRAIRNQSHLHNQYFQLWSDGSIVAMVLILLYFIYLYKLAPSPLTLGVIAVFAFSFIADVFLYRPKTYVLFLFISAILIKEYSSNGRGTNSIGQDTS